MSDISNAPITNNEPDSSAALSEAEFVEKMQHIVQQSSFNTLWEEMKSLLREAPIALYSVDPVQALLTAAAYHEW